MIVALIDNGSVESAAHLNLRRVATALTERTGSEVHAVSWKHSDRIRAAALGDQPARTLAPWLREQVRRGEREFVFVPFFISPQGAIGSALCAELEHLQTELGGFRYTFTTGLAAHGTLARIVADRIRETIARQGLKRPPVIVVDHGGPSPASAALRNHVALEAGAILGREVREVMAASMEGVEHPHNHPLFSDVLATADFGSGDVVVAPLFLSPGRHAGARGDLAEIAIAAEDRLTAAPLQCHFTELVGTHPLVVPALADALTQTLVTFSAAA